ncbi:hypothetical protein BDR03DRAFT_119394 [Suillus americanus]|nr:hypothetical protein BDR03DRAFT_119394 [Suillus americanus]
MNLRQRQRWSLITVLYMVVRTSCYAIAWSAIVLTPQCSRYAILEYHILCMCSRPTDCRRANSSSLTISANILGMSHMHYIQFF